MHKMFVFYNKYIYLVPQTLIIIRLGLYIIKIFMNNLLDKYCAIVY